MDPNAGAPPASKRKTSPWMYVGCGCAILLVLAILAGIGFIWMLRQQTRKSFKQGFTEPRVREQRTREILPYRELPAGYHPLGSLSIPFIMDMAMLSDEEPAAGRFGKFRERGFLFMSMRLGRIPTSEERKRRILEGTDSEVPWMRYSGWRQGRGEHIRDGNLDAGGAHIGYTASRGDFNVDSRRHQAISAFLLCECPDRHLRFGIWFVPDPAPAQPLDQVDLTGTPADPKAIADFANHFQLCPGE
ncbi:MAG TPA: hypothetical protein VHR45_17940 [Thermoanaerobaculia bacterium]|nr:hypothetical protein [Thermoanaerobaculia bacterium]